MLLNTSKEEMYRQDMMIYLAKTNGHYAEVLDDNEFQKIATYIKLNYLPADEEIVNEVYKKRVNKACLELNESLIYPVYNENDHTDKTTEEEKKEETNEDEVVPEYNIAEAPKLEDHHTGSNFVIIDKKDIKKNKASHKCKKSKKNKKSNKTVEEAPSVITLGGPIQEETVVEKEAPSNEQSIMHQPENPQAETINTIGDEKVEKAFTEEDLDDTTPHAIHFNYDKMILNIDNATEPDENPDNVIYRHIQNLQTIIAPLVHPGYDFRLEPLSNGMIRLYVYNPNFGTWGDTTIDIGNLYGHGYYMRAKFFDEVNGIEVDDYVSLNESNIVEAFINDSRPLAAIDLCKARSGLFQNQCIYQYVDMNEPTGKIDSLSNGDYRILGYRLDNALSVSKYVLNTDYRFRFKSFTDANHFTLVSDRFVSNEFGAPTNTAPYEITVEIAGRLCIVKAGEVNYTYDVIDEFKRLMDTHEYAIRSFEKVYAPVPAIIPQQTMNYNNIPMQQPMMMDSPIIVANPENYIPSGIDASGIVTATC